MSHSEHSFAPTLARFSGFAGDYDCHRPAPPAGLAALLAQYTGLERPARVIDLGSGTGLSSRYWAERAQQVIGVEPSADMRSEAVSRTSAANVHYREGYAHVTGLPPRHAQVVTCVQSLHWMEPQGTFAEAARLLTPGGVFAAVDYDWPPMSASWRTDQAWSACQELATRLESTLPGARPPRWDKSGHAERMRASGHFRFVRDAALQHVDAGSWQRCVGLLRSQGGVMDLLKAGYSESDLGIPELERLARLELGDEDRPIYWTARIRIGVV